MKNRLIISLAAMLGFMFLWAGAVQAQVNNTNPDAITGVWKSGSGQGHIKIYKEGNKYFGQLVWMQEPVDPETGKPKVDKNNPDKALRKRPLLGLINLRSFEYAGKNVWENGKIYDPEKGKDYSCVMTLTAPDRLEVRGFIGISLIGRTDVWTRVPDQRK
jgi:uncharacterized protein (DUF2147 family)